MINKVTDSSVDSSIGAVETPPPGPITRRGHVVQVIRFGAVGVINTVVDLAVLNALILIAHTGERGAMYALFKTIAFAAVTAASINRDIPKERRGGMRLTTLRSTT